MEDSDMYAAVCVCESVCVSGVCVYSINVSIYKHE